MIDVLVDDRAVTRYVDEILTHAGLPWRRQTADRAAAEPPSPGVVLLVGRRIADRALRDRLSDFVRSGGALIAVGGTWGLGELFGVDEADAHEEGYLSVASDHPITAGLTSSLHVFGTATLRVSTGTSLGTVRTDDRREVIGDAVVIHRVGQGVAVAIAADIPSSVHRIQHGIAVHRDGVPAPDGTAPIDDDILKCDDGIVLSWEHDRARTPLAAPVPDCPGIHEDFPDGDTPWFAQPVADELRALLLQAICWAAADVGLPLPMTWPWPRGLPAVGLISHDSDLNIDASAGATLRLLEEADIRSTWCMMEGPTYPDRFLPETFSTVAGAGHETALHYNALDRDGGRWGREDLRAQANWLRETAGIGRIASNKNHYTRWEGGVEFFHWLEDAGIGSDQSKGPSKKGNVGYPFGSCLPWFPYDLDQSRAPDVLEIPLQAQDLWLTTPTAVAGPIFDQTLKHHGVAHFLFHQIHLLRRPDVTQAMLRVIADGRERGLEWWTSEQIAAWERRRRTISITCQATDPRRYRLDVRSSQPEPGFSSVIILPTATRQGTPISVRGPFQSRSIVHYNQRALLLTWDLAEGATTLEIDLT